MSPLGARTTRAADSLAWVCSELCAHSYSETPKHCMLESLVLLLFPHNSACGEWTPLPPVGGAQAILCAIAEEVLMADAAPGTRRGKSCTENQKIRFVL